MGVQTIVLNVPILLNNKEKTAWCPFFNETFAFDRINDESDTIMSIDVDNRSHGLDKQVDINRTVVRNFSQIMDILYDCASKSFKEGNIEEPPGVESYKDIELEEGDVWLIYSIKLQIEKGYAEAVLPKISLVSALVFQVLAVCSLAVSIHVKGISAPLTILLSLNSALSTLINFTQSDTTTSVARIGRYLDYTPCKRYCENIYNLKNNMLFVGSASFFLANWLGTVVAGSISAFSETEIIDRAGYNANLTFLTDEVIFAHALLFTVTGGITVGTFGGHFAVKAAYNLSGWLREKIDACSKNDSLSADKEHEYLLFQSSK